MYIFSIKKERNFSYLDYVTRLRMEKAYELLRDTNMTIREITLAIGYLDENSFRKKVKAYFGASIQDIRNKVNTAQQKNV